MLNLQRQVEKQSQAKKDLKKIKIWFVVFLLLFLYVHLFTFSLNTTIVPLICTFALILTIIVAYFVKCYQLNKTTNQIIRSIERILETTLQPHLDEDSFLFVDCYNHNDKYFSFSIEIYDDDITYDALANIVEPLCDEISSIISEQFTSLYRIERSEEL